MARRKRITYQQWQIDLVVDAYPGCTSRQDKLALCRRAKIPTLEQLYNLAARLGVTRHAIDFDPVTGTYVDFDYRIPDEWKRAARRRGVTV
jgi:hypothetical protein